MDRKTFRAVLAVVVGLWSYSSYADEPNDELTVRAVPKDVSHLAFVVDFAMHHMIDGRVHIVDGNTGSYLGLISTGFSAHFTMSPDHKELYASSTYYDRGTKGHRTDVVEVFDAATWLLKREVVIPSKHAEAAPYPGLLVTSRDGKYLFVQNATPASSVTVIDIARGVVVGELGTAGCWSIWAAPNANNRISSVCGDGALLTLTFNDKGKVTQSSRSAPIFDPETDPMFVQGVDTGNKIVFISFKGMVHTVDLSGETAVQETPWSIIPTAWAKDGWRPGGYQMLAYHQKTGRLFLTTHMKGREGSHKHPADEIWVVDFAGRRILQRVRGEDAIALNVTQDDHPKLFATTEQGALLILDADGSVVRKSIVPNLVDTATEVVTQ